MAMSEKDKKQITGLVGFLAVAGAGLFIYFVHMPNATKISTIRRQIDSATVLVDSARRDLARGSVETLRLRVQDYLQSVKLMRRLVPDAGEVPNLIDDVSSRARRRGVNVAQFTPLGVEEGTPFQTHRYRFSVIGHFDQIGEFLSDVGSLPRIMVPYDVSVNPANPTAGKVYGDSTGALLEVGFQLRTFVKPPGSAADTLLNGGAD
ncbi:MAG: type 4a pilus biogenesis protein PilO [Gemmatimonadetes bacterium]|nr:type 4a pilus biogenesis protein PilO [Gemmatimonadota bacterium]